MKVDFHKALCFDVFINIYKLCEKNILQLLVITLFKIFFCVALIVDIYTFHFVKYFKVFSLRVRLYIFLEWCLF